MFLKMMTTFPSFIWRGSLYFFPTYIWGLKQVNNNAQRLSEAVAAIHRNKGFLVQVRKEHIMPEQSPIQKKISQTFCFKEKSSNTYWSEELLSTKSNLGAF